MKNRLQKILSVLLVSVMLLSSGIPFGAVAQGAENACGANVCWELIDSVLRIYCEDSETNGSIDSYDWNGSKDAPWYESRDVIKIIQIESGVVSVGDCAFCRLKNVHTVLLPADLKTIGSKAFFGCESLEAIALPNKVETIKDGAFWGCKSLRNINIPDAVQTIGENAFTDCPMLASFSVGANNKYFCCEDGVLFSFDKETLVRYPQAKEGTGYTVPKTVKRLGVAAFLDAEKLETVMLPAALVEIAAGAFEGCRNLSTCALPSNLLKIGERAFRGCVSLTEITIPENTIRIEERAFSRTGLRTVRIPRTVSALGDGVFGACQSLTEIRVDADNINYCDQDGILYSKDKKTLIQYPAGKKEKDNRFVVPNGVETIAAFAFTECTNLKTVLTADSVAAIGKQAFYGCTNLERLHLTARIKAPESEDTPVLDGVVGECPNVVICCYTDTCYAREYALDNGIPFEVCEGHGIHQHDWQTDDPAATCTKSAHLDWTCVLCGDTYSEDVEALGHDLKKINTVAPTCTEDGYNLLKCQRDGCDYTEKEYTEEALGHLFEYGAAVPPTCAEDGYTPGTCARCGETDKKFIVEKLGHAWDAGQKIDPTCTDKGYTLYTCVRCGDTKKDGYVDAYGHTWDSGRKIDATCEEAGYTLYTCVRCGTTKKEGEQDALGHDFYEVVVERTCLEDGYTKKVCKRCDYYEIVEGSEVAAYGSHDFVYGEPVEKTCLEDGYTPGVCSRCGAEDKKDIDPAYGSHDFVYGEPVKATCLEDGYTPGKCSRCDAEDKKDVVPALDHDWQESEIQEPTCTDDGKIAYICSRCFDEKTEIAQSLGHQFGTPEVIAPTCTEDGYTLTVCERCGAEVESDFVAAPGHRFERWTVVKQATEYEEGEGKWVCTDCGAEKTQIIEKLPKTPLILSEGNITIRYKDKVTLTASEAVKWSSNNSGYVTIDPVTGELTAINPGTAIITAKSVQGNKEAKCTVTVRMAWWQWFIRLFLFGTLWY